MLEAIKKNWKLILSFKLGMLLGWLAGSEIFSVVMIVVLFGMGVVVGMYIASQIEKDINRRIK